MNRRDMLSFGLTLGLTALATGCDGTAPAEPGEPADQVALALDALAGEANQAGDADAADGFASGALALRIGVRPTPIVVTVRGAEVPYQAVVVAIVRRLPAGTRVVYRHLIAWTPDQGRPAQVLQVSQLTDQASFGYPSSLASAADPRGRARGTWADRVRGEIWVATAGSSTITPVSTGAPCQVQPSGFAGATCVQARFDVRADGGFQQLTRRDSATPVPAVLLRIATQAAEVNGVLIAPVGDGGA